MKTETLTMTGAESLLRTLFHCGVDVCFANPGTTEMHLVHAVDAVPEMRGVLCLFEGVCTGAADGFGRMTGRPATTLLHLGAGLGNGVANLHNARRARTPIINLVGNHASYHLQYDAPLTSDIDSLARSVSCWYKSDSTAESLARDGADAVTAALTATPDSKGQIATLIIGTDAAWGDVTKDYTFVNDRLARHYEIPNIHGNHFRRVRWPDDRRAGLLGLGSILTLTSYANRTSPVARGKWILENLMGTPPPEPPANVPGLEEREAGEPPKSLRARMALHRGNPVCASCHRMMDPLGFALENFDAIGRWRTTEETGIPGELGPAIDPSGTTPDGSKFDGAAGLRKILASRDDQFVGTVTERLLTYAVGRKLEVSDMPAVRQIQR